MMYSLTLAGTVWDKVQEGVREGNPVSGSLVFRQVLIISFMYRESIDVRQRTLSNIANVLEFTNIHLLPLVVLTDLTRAILKPTIYHSVRTSIVCEEDFGGPLIWATNLLMSVLTDDGGECEWPWTAAR